MKKMLAIAVLFATVFILPTVISISNVDIKIDDASEPTGFTHTVFAEYVTATWCPACPVASQALYNLYEKNETRFYFVSIVYDANPIAKERSKQFHTIAVPTTYFDGGDKNMVGNIGSNVNMTSNAYKSIIEECGNRVVKPVNISTSAVWVGDNKIRITVEVKNNGIRPYFGKVRSYVTEIESRWNDVKGDPYHFALLDFAIDKAVFISSLSSKTFTVTWDGNNANGNQHFTDLSKDNLMVFSTISQWMPHLRAGYESNKYTQRYLAFFIDSVSADTLS